MIQLDVLQPESCNDCGLCCEGNGSPVVLYTSRPHETGPHPFRPSGLPQHLIDDIDANFLGLYRGQEPQDRCLWFDPTMRTCRHYEWRPMVCHEFELGGTACIETRRPFLAPENQ